jgi:hypothetical protein
MLSVKDDLRHLVTGNHDSDPDVYKSLLALSENGHRVRTRHFGGSITSTTGPDPGGLAPQYVGAVSTTDMVKDLFDGLATNIVGGDYVYSYQHGDYVQSSQPPYTTGDVTGH